MTAATSFPDFGAAGATTAVLSFVVFDALVLQEDKEAIRIKLENTIFFMITLFGLIYYKFQK